MGIVHPVGIGYFVSVIYSGAYVGLVYGMTLSYRRRVVGLTEGTTLSFGTLYQKLAGTY